MAFGAFSMSRECRESCGPFSSQNAIPSTHHTTDIICTSVRHEKKSLDQDGIGSQNPGDGEMCTFIFYPYILLKQKYVVRPCTPSRCTARTLC